MGTLWVHRLDILAEMCLFNKEMKTETYVAVCTKIEYSMCNENIMNFK